MKQLINNLIGILKAAILAGEITVGNIVSNDVYKGYWNTPNTPPRGTYITVDEGGESTEMNPSIQNQTRTYNIRIEFAIYHPVVETALDNILDLTNQIKTVLEKQTSRQKDDMIWGVDIVPFEMGDPDDDFWRGRQVTIRYLDYEDTYNQY